MTFSFLFWAFSLAALCSDRKKTVFLDKSSVVSFLQKKSKFSYCRLKLLCFHVKLDFSASAICIHGKDLVSSFFKPFTNEVPLLTEITMFSRKKWIFLLSNPMCFLGKIRILHLWKLSPTKSLCFHGILYFFHQLLIVLFWFSATPQKDRHATFWRKNCNRHTFRQRYKFGHPDVRTSGHYRGEKYGLCHILYLILNQKLPIIPE